MEIAAPVLDPGARRGRVVTATLLSLLMQSFPRVSVGVTQFLL
jgi:hypothetical protein